MSQRKIEVNLVGAKDLKNGKFFGKQSPCAVLFINGTTMRKEASHVATHMGTEPVWNQRFEFTVDDNWLSAHQKTAYLIIQIFGSRDFSDPPLGTAQVPLATAVQRVGEPHFAAHPLRRPSGRVQGYVNLSVQAGYPGKIPEGAPPPATGVPAYAPNPAGMYAQAAPQQYPMYGPPGGGYPPNPYAQGGYPPPGYPSYGMAPQASYYQQGGQPNVVYARNNQQGGYGGGYGMGGGMGGRMMGGGMGGGMMGGGMGGMGGMGAGLLLGGLGGLALGEAL